MKASIKILFLLVILFNAFHISAQDLRSGEITYQSVGNSAVQFKVIIYTQISTAVNRPYILLYWLGAIPETLYTSPPIIVASDIYQYTYLSDSDIYPSSGVYDVYIDESFLDTGIINIPNSENKDLYLHATVNINPNYSGNSSPAYVNQQPFQWSCCNWIYDASATDVDNDSLSYSLIVCNDAGYVLPNAAIDSITGHLKLFPASVGKYALNVKVDEWKKIGSTYHFIDYIERILLINVDTLTSVSELSETEVNIYPNPSPSIIIINYRSSTQPYSLSIKDAIGREEKEEMLPANAMKKELDVSELSPGVYFLTLENNKGQVTRKLIKE